ncbi:polyprenyl synthetase family protein [Alkalibaculum sp. M08DMB]|uniref:Polyprenyl synthetase family protein n=1 Tax=Alkalibaculum sporogenes TaxID=2655001 RepID=A0A6A7KD24_9FIRM|nr:polyprenyl synthetase family protein [Alkalibaculum sporogenes]MPW26903.1 polyprenyl synthetase family protein [Alkalibaculum sporogenes]
MNSFWNEYPKLQLELDEVTKLIENSVKDSHNFITSAVEDTIHSGGKMLRPALVILGSKFGNEPKNSILNLAAIVEMLHVATLIHDDIIDESKLRRGIESVQSKYGKDSAVFIGDYLFAKLFTLMSKDFHQETMVEMSKVIMRICQGELIQYSFRYKYNSSIMHYLKIITGKTASLFSLSLYIGSEESNADETVKKLLAKTGYRIGMAFQIIDDCLDYSSKNIIKKSTMNDLKQGYLTLPVIYALQNDRKGYLENLLKNGTFTKNESDNIHALVVENKGLEKSRELALKYTNKAYDSMNKLPDCESKETIKFIIDKLLIRDY